MKLSELDRLESLATLRADLRQYLENIEERPGSLIVIGNWGNDERVKVPLSTAALSEIKTHVTQALSDVEAKIRALGIEIDEAADDIENNEMA